MRRNDDPQMSPTLVNSAQSRGAKASGPNGRLARRLDGVGHEVAFGAVGGHGHAVAAGDRAAATGAVAERSM